MDPAARPPRERGAAVVRGAARVAVVRGAAPRQVVRGPAAVAAAAPPAVMAGRAAAPVVRVAPEAVAPDAGSRLKGLAAARAKLAATAASALPLTDADVLAPGAAVKAAAGGAASGRGGGGGGNAELHARLARVPGPPAFAAYCMLREAALGRAADDRAAVRALRAVDAELAVLAQEAAGAGAAAPSPPLPPLITGGVAAVYAFLTSAAARDPGACLEPFRILARIVAAFDVQAALREPAELVGGLARMFAAWGGPTTAGAGSAERASGSAAAASTRTDALQVLSLSSLVALCLARGTAATVVEGARALIDHVVAGSTVMFPAPRSLQVRARAACVCVCVCCACVVVSPGPCENFCDAVCVYRVCVIVVASCPYAV
jgi:hypothetical protein